MIPNPYDASSVVGSEEDYDLLESLLTCESGWATVAELSWNVAGQDSSGRRRVRALLVSLGRQDVLDRIFVRNNGEPWACVRLDHDAIRDVMGGYR